MGGSSAVSPADSRRATAPAGARTAGTSAGANAFSKTVEMHAHSVALHLMHYNFVKIHSTLRTTPAQAAGVTDRLWGIEDLVALLEG